MRVFFFAVINYSYTCNLDVWKNIDIRIIQSTNHDFYEK